MTADGRFLRILFHTRSTGGGGAERVTATIATGLAARGHRVTLAVDGLDPAAGTLPGVDVRVLPAGHGPALVALARLMRSDVDIAVAALALAVVRSAAAKAATLSRLPLVIAYHGFEEYKLGGAGPLAYSGMPVLKRIADRVVCVSDALSRTMIERWGAPAGRTVTLHNPVVLPEPTGPVRPAALRPKLVAAVGRLSPEKGIGDLIDAFALVADRDSRLVIAGDGPEAEALKARAGHHGLTARVHFAGWVDDPLAVFRDARVAVIPSRTEAFSLATVEALAAGAAVVATDCGGPREILEDGRHGRLVPVGDVPSLAAAIAASLANPGDDGERRARAACFSVERRLDAWEAMLREVARAASSR